MKPRIRVRQKKYINGYWILNLRDFPGNNFVYKHRLMFGKYRVG